MHCSCVLKYDSPQKCNKVHSVSKETLQRLTDFEKATYNQAQHIWPVNYPFISPKVFCPATEKEKRKDYALWIDMHDIHLNRRLHFLRTRVVMMGKERVHLGNKSFASFSGGMTTFRQFFMTVFLVLHDFCLSYLVEELFIVKGIDVKLMKDVI